MRIVMKFGGTSISSSGRIEKVRDIVSMKKGSEIIVVVSAMSSVTDSLVEMANKVAKGGATEDEIKAFVSKLSKKHEEIARDILSDKEARERLAEISNACRELEKTLTGIAYVGDLTPRSLDYVVSFGERLSAPLVCGALNSAGLKSKWYSGYEAGIMTDSNYGMASPIWNITRKKVRKILEPVLGSSIPVLTGFIAGDKEGNITTLGRGGSDFTASIIGSALNADEIWIWTDVDGIMTTDPRMVKEARTISVISYIEAMELAFFGAEVLHPRSIEPAMESGIPVRVKNTFNPEHKGTLIVVEQKKSSAIVKAISIMEDASLLTISGVGMVGMPGVAAKVFGALGREKVNILMISQGSSEVNISIAVKEEDLKRAVDTLKKEFAETKIVKNVDCDKDVSLIAVVGAGMRGTKGVAARVFSAVARAGANVLMIAQGSSEVNISFVVSSKDAKSAVKALHDEFIVGSDRID